MKKNNNFRKLISWFLVLSMIAHSAEQACAHGFLAPPVVPDQILFTPTPLQKAMAVKPWMNAGILPPKRETDEAAPVKVWGFTPQRVFQSAYEEKLYWIKRILLNGSDPSVITWEKTLDTFVRTYWKEITSAITEAGYPDVEFFVQHCQSISVTPAKIQEVSLRLYSMPSLPVSSSADIKIMKSFMDRHSEKMKKTYMAYVEKKISAHITQQDTRIRPLHILLFGPAFFEEFFKIIGNLQELYAMHGWSFNDFPVRFSFIDKNNMIYNMYNEDRLRFPPHAVPDFLKKYFIEKEEGFAPDREYFDRFINKFSSLDLGVGGTLHIYCISENMLYDLVFINNVTCWIAQDYQLDIHVLKNLKRIIDLNGLIFFKGSKIEDVARIAKDEFQGFEVFDKDIPVFIRTTEKNIEMRADMVDTSL